MANCARLNRPKEATTTTITTTTTTTTLQTITTSDSRQLPLWNGRTDRSSRLPWPALATSCSWEDSWSPGWITPGTDRWRQSMPWWSSSNSSNAMISKTSPLSGTWMNWKKPSPNLVINSARLGTPSFISWSSGRNDFLSI